MISYPAFKKLFAHIVSVLILVALPALGEEDIDLPEGFSLEYFHADDCSNRHFPQIPQMAYPHAINEIQQADANQALMTFEGSPSATVAGCVNAISGTFFESQADLALPSIQPLTVQRTYCSSEKEWFFRQEGKE